jgi:hypothetical protein
VLGQVVNTATAESAEFDPDLSNNRGSAALTGLMPSKRNFLAGG